MVTGWKQGVALAAWCVALGAGMAAAQDTPTEGEGAPMGQHGGGARDPGALFDRIDADGDGVVSTAEWQDAAARIERRGGPKGGGRLFERADADGDGNLTRAEWDEAHARMQAWRDGERPSPEHMAERVFSEIDADGDGMLSLEEFRAGMEEMRSRHGKRGPGGERGGAGRGQEGGPPPMDAPMEE